MATSRRWSTTCSIGGAALRPDERPDVGRAAPRLEGRAGHRGQSAAKATRRFALLDLAGGTGDVAFRVADAGGPGTHVTVADINAEMLAVGRERAAKRGLDDIDIRRGQCRGAAVPRHAASTPSPSRSASATCRASTWRSREAHRVLKIGGRFLCLEFSSVDVPGLDRLYELYSFNVIPALGRAVTGDAEAYRYLVESIRKFPRPEEFADMIRAAGFRRVSFEPMTGGMVALHSGWRLCACRDRRGRPSRPSRPRRLRVRARGRVRARRSRAAAAAGADRAQARAADRAADQRQRASGRLAAALTRLGPTYVKLGQFLATRPDVVGVALARDLESLQDKMAPFPQAEAEAVVAAALGKPLSEILRVVRPGGRRRLDRAGASRRGRDARGPQSRRREGAAARHRAALPRRSRRLHLRRAPRREPVGRGAAAAHDRGRRHAARARSRSRWICGSRPPRSPRWRRTPRTIPTSACRRSTGTAPRSDVLTLEWIDGTPLHDRADARGQGLRPQALGRAR